MSRVKVNSRKNLLSAKLFSVDELLVSYGEKQDIFHGVYVKSAVVVIPIAGNNEIFLTKQYRHIKNKVYLELPAGLIEDNEDPLAAAKRELKEEVGITAASWTKLPKVEIGSSIFDWDFNYFLARGLDLGEQKLDLSEDIEIMKIPFENAIEKILAGEIIKLSTITGILLVNEYLKKKKI